MGSWEAPLSVRLCRQRVTSVSAPLGQFSTSRSSSGEFMPIPRIYRQKRGETQSGVRGWGPRGRAWGAVRDQAAGRTLGLWRRNWQERADLKYSHR